MTTHSQVSPGRLTDEELLARVHCLARDERAATALLVAHLAELDERRLYLNEGCSSLHAYCVNVLHLSEGAAYNRIEAARTGQKFPVVFEMLAAGDIHLTAIRLLRPHLTPANHQGLLEQARHRTKRQVEELIARLRPLPDVPNVVRKLPVRGASALAPATRIVVDQAVPSASDVSDSPASATAPAASHRPAAVLAPLSPERYRIQVTASREMYERLQKLRSLLRHRIPDGDPARILDEALIALLEKVEKQKCGAARRPRASRPDPERTEGSPGEVIAAPQPGRHIPADVRREVWKRDGGRCTFRSPAGRRCDEEGWIEFHHLEPFAVGGAACAENIALRCAAHNRFEAVVTLGQDVVARARSFQEKRRRTNSFRDELMAGVSDP